MLFPLTSAQSTHLNSPSRKLGNMSQTPSTSANSSGFLQAIQVAGSKGVSLTHKVPAQLSEMQQLFLKYLCDMHPSLLALALQALAPKSGSQPVCRAIRHSLLLLPILGRLVATEEKCRSLGLKKAHHPPQTHSTML